MLGMDGTFEGFLLQVPGVIEAHEDGGSDSHAVVCSTKLCAKDQLLTDPVRVLVAPVPGDGGESAPRPWPVGAGRALSTSSPDTG